MEPINSSNIEWLQSMYHETPVEGPEAKKIKLSDIQEALTAQFPLSIITPQYASQAIQEAFPNAQKKRLGRERNTFIVGVKQSMPTHVTDVTDVPGELAAEQQKNQELCVKVQQLEARVHQLECQAARIHELEWQVHELEYQAAVGTQQFLPPSALDHQMDKLLQQGDQVLNGPNTPERMGEFSFSTITSEFKSLAPEVYSLFEQLGQTQRHSTSEEETTVEQHKIVTSLSTLLNARSQRAKGLQLLLSLMLVARATSKQAMATLNHAGICMSYWATWGYLRQLTAEAKYLEAVKAGRWLWVYDNLNVHQTVRHEREDQHSTMLNMTARLAVSIQNLPDGIIDWNDSTSSRDVNDLTVNDILPSAVDAAVLKKRAVHFVMHFLVCEFRSLKDLKSFLPPEQSPHPVKKSTIMPMKILFKDEKYKAQTIDILTRLMSDADLTGKPEVVVGDQLTCKVIRGAKRWREPDQTVKLRLSWANEVPGDFHFLWECLQALFLMFWGSPAHVGSLCNLREYVQRTGVDKAVKIFNRGDEFLIHAFKSHLIAAICKQLSIQSPDDQISHESSLLWLESKAEEITSKALYPTSTSDPTHNLHRSFLHTAFLYIDLRNAIRWEDGPQIIRHWRLWLPRFLGTGCKNYAIEAANLIVNIMARFPRHISYIAVHNRTVNMDGLPGHGKPIDQLMEHYNLVIKETLRSCGANATQNHIEEVSLAALFLMEAAKKADREFGVSQQSGKHTVREATTDITKMAKHLTEHQVTAVITGRTTPPFHDVTEDGWKKLTKSWLDQSLTPTAETGVASDLQDESGEIETNYELYDVL